MHRSRRYDRPTPPTHLSPKSHCDIGACLYLPHLGVFAVQGEQLLVRSLLYDAAFFKHYDPVSDTGGRKSVGYEYDRFIPGSFANVR